MSGIKVAVFYASVGTGHKSAAKAISDWSRREVSGAETMCVDTLTDRKSVV
jgi:processive 1,2-diacylglycerol beta-glucosyltransferase